MDKYRLSPGEKGQIEVNYRNDLMKLREELDHCLIERNVLEAALEVVSKSFSVICSTWKELLDGYLIPIGCSDSYIEFLDCVITETAVWIWKELNYPMGVVLNGALIEPGSYTLEEWAKENNQFGWYPESEESRVEEDG